MALIDDLLTKYRAGREPGLDDLLNVELLQILQRGLAEARTTPVGILLPEPTEAPNSAARWEKGRFINPQGMKWQNHCQVLRTWRGGNGLPSFDKDCQAEDMARAMAAEEHGKPVFYLCYCGMLDCAVPILVKDRTVAVLFTGQRRPAQGRIWSEELLGNVAEERSVSGTSDAWDECEGRNRRIMAAMRDARPGEEPPDLVALARQAAEIQPAEVPQLLQTLRDAAEQIGLLAERTLGYERNILRAHFASRVASLLAVSDEDFWHGFSDFLSELCSFLGVEQAALYLRQRDNDTQMRRFACAPAELADQLPAVCEAAPGLAGLKGPNCRPIEVGPRRIPLELCLGAQLFSPPFYVLQMEATGPLGMAVFGWGAQEPRPARLPPSSLSFLEELFLEVAVLIENRRQLQSRDLYVTDFAHEVRSPVAAVLATAQNLAEGRITDVLEVRVATSRVLSRLRRLQVAIERFMILEEMLEGRKQLAPKAVSIHDVAMECKREYTDLAAERSVAIEVAKGIASLPAARADRDAFKHALGNLVSNAVKYADRATTVVIEGRVAGGEIKIDVGDVGIPVPKDALPFLGQRHFRTKEASKRDPTGTGIGLTLVQRFLKLVGGRLEFKCEPHSSGSHHVIVSMFLPR